MDEYIIKNGQINSNVSIIKKGVIEICIKGNLKDIFNVMNYYRDNFSDLSDKKYEMSDFSIRKIYKLMKI